MAVENKPWNLESFVDALVLELDKTRETLAVKAINKPLSYTVKDMSLDVQIFPTYDGDEVKFTAARPGEQGASKITLQLGSITDQQVRATTKKPASKEDIQIDNIEIDQDTKKSLRKIGVTSVNDLKQIEEKNVDIEKAAPSKISYSDLANMIRKTERNRTPPVVKKVTMSKDKSNQPMLVIDGQNLVTQKDFESVAVINNKLAKVIDGDKHQIRISLTPDHLSRSSNELVVTLDPYSVFKLNLKNQG